MRLSPLTVLALALPLRLLSALLSTAFFQPDEYWQNLEPAYQLVFSSSNPDRTFSLGRTWEWRIALDAPEGGWWTWEVARRLVKEGGYGGIRSPLSVLPTAGVYWVLKRVGWDNSHSLVLAPRLLQALFAASTDLALFLLARRVLGARYAGAAVLASLTSFFHFYTLSRTFSNSTETTLTAWALVFWPFPSSTTSNLTTALALAATATLMRPSNAVVWVVLGGQLVWRIRGWRGRGRVLSRVIVVGLSAALLSLLLDTTFYHTPTFTPLRFLHFNLIRRVSHFYGTSSTLYYLVQGVPVLLVTQVPFFVDGVLRTSRWRNGAGGGVRDEKALKELRWTLVGTVAVYSMLEHKEWRFLHPLLPVMHLFVALSLTHSSSSAPTSTSTSTSVSLSSSPVDHAYPAPGLKKTYLALLLLSLPPAVYLTTFHGVGQNRVMHYLSIVLHAERRASLSGEAETAGGGTVGFLMPCHSTGWQAFLHAPWLEPDAGEEGRKGEKAWYLTCEPPVLGQNPSTYLDQSDYFYSSPSLYLSQHLPSTVDPRFPPSPPLPLSPPDPRKPYDLGWRHTWPQRLVLFSNLLSIPCDPPPQLASGAGACGEEGTIGGLLTRKGYTVEKTFWNALGPGGGWNEDGRRRGRVVVLRWEGGGGREEEDGVEGETGETGRGKERGKGRGREEL